jgi:hypothetical protein
LIHYDSAPEHTALALQQCLAAKKHGCGALLVFKNEIAADNTIQKFSHKFTLPL